MFRQKVGFLSVGTVRHNRPHQVEYTAATSLMRLKLLTFCIQFVVEGALVTRLRKRGSRKSYKI